MPWAGAPAPDDMIEVVAALAPGLLTVAAGLDPKAARQAGQAVIVAATLMANVITIETVLAAATLPVIVVVFA